MEIQILKTMPGDENFHFFEEVLPVVYSPGELQLKLNENINSDLLVSTFIALQDSKAVGRCCVYSNKELNYSGRSTACIGNYECIQDARISEALFRSASEEAKKTGAVYIIGPMNGSTWDTYRLGKYGSPPNFFLEPFYPDYYHRHFLNAGFEKIARYVSNTDRTGNLLDERIERVEKEFARRGITFRNIDLENYESELKNMHSFCMDAFKSNFLFSSINQKPFVEKYLKVKPWIKPEYVILAEDGSKETAGFIFCLENYFDRTEKGLIIKTLAKKPSIRFGGMGNLLTTLVKKKALENGYNYIIHAFMLESNASKSLSGHFSGELSREYYLYGKDLGK